MCKENKKAETVGIFKLLKIFPTDDSVLDYLENLIWSKGVHCNRCKGTDKLTQQKDKHNYWCGSCRKYFNVKTNTPIENSNIPLQKWMVAIYLFMTARKGISSLQLSKELDITQKSAWFMTQRIREMLTNNGNQTLSGIIEIDETYIGGLEKNKHADKRTANNQGRSTKTKMAVVGMKQRGGKVVAKAFDSVNSSNIQKYIDGNVAQGSVLSTDEAIFYRPIKGYAKLMVNHSVSEWVNGMASTNGIESVWAVLKRGYHGTFHHFSKKHIDRYVNEFTFRLNEGSCKADTVDRIKSVVLNMSGKQLSYRQLTD